MGNIGCPGSHQCQAEKESMIESHFKSGRFIVLPSFAILVTALLVSCEKKPTEPENEIADHDIIVPALYLIEVIPTEVNVETDSTYQFSAIGKDADMNKMRDLAFTWTSHNLTVGTVDQNGLFTAKSSGSTFLIAKSGTIESEQVRVNVYDPVFLEDIDGNVYKAVKIGDQWWMAENLKVTHYRNGDPIPRVPSERVWPILTSGAYCEYENDTSFVKPYGLLYNWYAAVDTRGLAPEGWHVPTDEEWKELELYLGISESDFHIWGNRGSDEGTKLKSTYGWNQWNKDKPCWPCNGTDVYGFRALPGGYRPLGTFGWSGVDFAMGGSWAVFWTTTIADLGTKNIWARGLFDDFGGIHRSDGHMWVGISVRCVKD